MQVPIKLLHPTFGKFEHLAETVKPTIASLNFVQTVCAQAKYYYAEEKDYEHVMRRVWTDLLAHLGGVSRPAVGATGRSVSDLALAVSTPQANLSCLTQLVLQVMPMHPFLNTMSHLQRFSFMHCMTC